MPSYTQTENQAGGAGAKVLRVAHEGTPPSSEGVITELGNDGVISAGFQSEVDYLVEPESADASVVIEGRVRCGEVVTGWHELLASTSFTADTTTVGRLQLSDSVMLFNEFRVKWNATSGGSASRIALAFG